MIGFQDVCRQQERIVPRHPRLLLSPLEAQLSGREGTSDSALLNLQSCIPTFSLLLFLIKPFILRLLWIFMQLQESIQRPSALCQFPHSTVARAGHGHRFGEDTEPAVPTRTLARRRRSHAHPASPRPTRLCEDPD